MLLKWSADRRRGGQCHHLPDIGRGELYTGIELIIDAGWCRSTAGQDRRRPIALLWGAEEDLSQMVDETVQGR